LAIFWAIFSQKASGHPVWQARHLVEKNVVQLEVSVDDAMRVQEEEADRDFRRVETKRKNKSKLLFLFQNAFEVNLGSWGWSLTPRGDL
jgi:hypothetical protein